MTTAQFQTLIEINTHLTGLVTQLSARVDSCVTKDELKRELSHYATKTDLENMKNEIIDSITDSVNDLFETYSKTFGIVQKDHEKRIIKLEKVAAV